MFLGDYSPQNPNAFNIGNVYPNAFFDYLSRVMPRRLKELFKWLEYLYVNCGQVFSVIKKFSEYPITKLKFSMNDPQQEKELAAIMDKNVKIKSNLIEIGIDYFLYGNAFISLFKPFSRWLVCKKCGTKHNPMNYDWDWEPKTFEFKITCSNPKCKHKGIAIVEHTKNKDPKKLKIVRWDPKNIDINSNPVTGEAEFYYTIPKTVRERIQRKDPDKFLINTLPWEFLLTVRDRKIFKFREGQIYHMKNPAPAGVNQEWGYPGLLGNLKPYFYTAILRKGNEALALERLVPWRVLYPQPTSSSNDPGQFVNLYRWRNELEDAVKKWRRDPNMVKLSPIPVGMQQIGGDARPLLTHQEIAQTEELIVTSMGVPKEFIYGGLTHAGGSVTLRMLENLLFTYTEQIIELSQWITDQVCSFMGFKQAKVDMVDFKLVDDIQQKQLLGQLMQNKMISATTFLKSMDLDPDQERVSIESDAVAEARVQESIQRKLREMQETLSNKVEQQISGDPLQYDPAAVMQVAQQQAEQLAQLPVEQRREQLAQLLQQDPVLHAVVTQQMAQIFRAQKNQGVGNTQPNIPVSPEYSGGSSPSTPRSGG